jgi:hypothetical protein
MYARMSRIDVANRTSDTVSDYDLFDPRSAELVAHVRGAPAGVVTACSWEIHVDRDA